MYGRLEIDRTIARETQRDLRRQAEQDRTIRRTCGRLERWLDRLFPGGRAGRGSPVKSTDLYLLNALAWMMAKE